VVPLPTAMWAGVTYVLEITGLTKSDFLYSIPGQ
jgi:hypothetical protein